MHLARPRVVVTGPIERGRFAWRATRRVVRALGAEPLRVTRPPIPDSFDALILSGGSHVHPSRYGQTPRHIERKYDPERDALEIDAFRRARRLGANVLGICRGMQLAVVSLGGDLEQNVWPTTSRRRAPTTLFPVRRVHVATQSRLARVLCATELNVNSLHKQAVRSLPNELRAVAWDENGLIQAVEAPGFVGVQWHPEYLTYRRTHRRLFAWLVDRLPAPGSEVRRPQAST